MRLTVVRPTGNEATAALIVMPRARSRASESVCVLPSSTLPIAVMAPALYSRRSVRLVLPASTWARMPRFSVRTERQVLRVGGHGRETGRRRTTHAVTTFLGSLTAGPSGEGSTANPRPGGQLVLPAARPPGPAAARR